MILGYFVLLVAIITSVVSAYYSVSGLATIFAGAFWPIIIMGSTLELGKLTAAMWLHKNWVRAEIQYKLYLVPALGVLMLLTSMGIFGGLSKAHLEQAAPTGDIAEQITLYDEKIATEHETIASAKRALKQMDEQVDQFLGRSDDVGGAARAVKVRKAQAPERAALNETINAANKEITKLNALRSPLANKLRKIENEIGPIKYVAALIYGEESTNAHVIEKAVRWVIILIVIVFDPLAIVLILAGSRQIAWAREDALREAQERAAAQLIESRANIAPTPLQVEVAEVAVVVAPPITTHTPPSLEKTSEPKVQQSEVPPVDAEPTTPVVVETSVVEPTVEAIEAVVALPPAPEPSYFTLYGSNTKEEPQEQWIDCVIDYNQQEPPVAQPVTAPPVTTPQLDHTIDLGNILLTEEEYEPDVDATLLSIAEFEYAVLLDRELASAVEGEISSRDARINTLSSDMATLEAQIQDLTAKNNAAIHQINELQEENLLLTGNPVNANFGTAYPLNAKKGDMFLRVDHKPSRLFKWNGTGWIEIEKTSTDAYSYDRRYLQYLINKINTGEYSLDELSQPEQDGITELLTQLAV